MDQVGDVVVAAIPVVLAVAAAVAAWWLVHWTTTRNHESRERLDVPRQILQVLVVIVGLVAVVLTLPVDLQIKGALLGAIGVALAAVIGLSSTTIVGNALAGLMLRTVRNYRVGDFLNVEGHFGRVTYRRLLATEIQTEDRDLTTLPNLFLVTHPVKVVRASGTVVSATVSIGYDVHRLQLEPHFMDAARDAGLSDPFVRMEDLGDHSVTYRVAGFLVEVKNLLSVRSALRAAIFDRLNDAGIEIVSPTFMNQRQTDPERSTLASRPATTTPPTSEIEPEDRIFDKAEAASALEELRAEHEAVSVRLQQLKEERRGAEGRAARLLDAEITRSEALQSALSDRLADQNGSAERP